MVIGSSKLKQIAPDDIIPNPENPRMIFREHDMRELRESIREVGIRVPIAVYQDKHKYVLLDGERRWRCAIKLNLQHMPALIQPKPNRLENLLMMFNIHNVRVQWDLLPMAYKLQDVKKMLEDDGKHASPKNLAGITGLAPATVKRALELLELPQKYQNILLKEALKPRDKQEVTADLFIEINKAYRVVEKYVPEVAKEISKSKFVNSMYKKYKTGTEKNLVNYRKISKIARAENTGIDKEDVAPILINLIKKNDYKIDDAYADTVSTAYKTRDLSNKAISLLSTLKEYRSARAFTPELRENLHLLKIEINRLLRRK